MKANVGSTDKILRILAVILILFFYFNHLITGTTATVFKILGVIFAVTALVGFCPLYAIFGIKSNSFSGR